MSKPKEVTIFCDRPRSRNTIKRIGHKDENFELNVGDEIRFIEYSAYQALERKLEVAVKALEQASDDHFVAEYSSELRKIEKICLEALAEINSPTEVDAGSDTTGGCKGE